MYNLRLSELTVLQAVVWPKSRVCVAVDIVATQRAYFLLLPSTTGTNELKPAPLNATVYAVSLLAESALSSVSSIVQVLTSIEAQPPPRISLPRRTVAVLRPPEVARPRPLGLPLVDALCDSESEPGPAVGENSLPAAYRERRSGCSGSSRAHFRLNGLRCHLQGSTSRSPPSPRL